jgi:hypothetical protein
MRQTQSERRAHRHASFTALQRRTALDLIAVCLREERSEADLRPDHEALERHPRLHRQPWRRPRRPSFAPLSVMETIRRYEASHGLN